MTSELLVRPPSREYCRSYDPANHREQSIRDHVHHQGEQSPRKVKSGFHEPQDCFPHFRWEGGDLLQLSFHLVDACLSENDHLNWDIDDRCYKGSDKPTEHARECPVTVPQSARPLLVEQPGGKSSTGLNPETT